MDSPLVPAGRHRPPDPLAFGPKTCRNPSSPTTPAPQQGTSTNTFRKPAASELKKRLTPGQFRVTQRCGTEPPFKNAYWNNKKPVFYVDVVSGEPISFPLTKFDSGSGWPSFPQPVPGARILEKEDRGTEGRSEQRCALRQGDSHLGYVFNDGREPTASATASTPHRSASFRWNGWRKKDTEPNWNPSSRRTVSRQAGTKVRVGPITAMQQAHAETCSFRCHPKSGNVGTISFGLSHPNPAVDSTASDEGVPRRS